MADRFSSDAKRQTTTTSKTGSDRRWRLAGVGLISFGFVAVAVASWIYYDAWSTRESWDTSPEAAALALQLAAPTPIWLPAATPAPVTVRIEPVPTPVAVVVERARPPEPTATPAPIVVTANDLSLETADFRFLDPPEPGAHARIAFSVANHAAGPSARILLGVPAPWFDNYSIIGSAPAVSQDRTDDGGLRTFSFPPVPPGATARYELHVTSLAEGTLAPTLKVLLDGDEQIGDASPSTFAPTPRPGPVMAIDIPRLKLKSGVVQTAWEPPPFAVGQIKGTANISTGNTVLVGHLTGAAGNVFAHLDDLKPGDELTAVSRGVQYPFVVSRIYESSNYDSEPIKQDDDARLTLMTCTGIWNPITRDYSGRLWVVAEAPEQAAQTIATAAATATIEAAATATAKALEPTATPVPTPFRGEPASPGGIGNTRPDLERTFGRPTGETSGKLVVFHPPSREVRVLFTPDPPRAALIAEIPSGGMSFDAAAREARKLFPNDTSPRSTKPEGNDQFAVDRFTSLHLASALGLASGDFSVIYIRDARGTISGIVLGLGDDFDALLQQARR